MLGVPRDRGWWRLLRQVGHLHLVDRIVQHLVVLFEQRHLVLQAEYVQFELTCPEIKGVALEDALAAEVVRWIHAAVLALVELVGDLAAHVEIALGLPMVCMLLHA